MGRHQQVRAGRARRMVAITMLGLGIAGAAASCTSGGATAVSDSPAASTVAAARTTTTAAPVSSSQDPPSTRPSTSSSSSRPSASPSSTKASTSARDPNELTPPSVVVHAVPGQEGYCGSIATAMQDLSTAALSALGGRDADDADKALRDVKDRYRLLADDAPDEIRADVQTLAHRLASFTDAAQLRDLNDDPAALAAGARFARWIKANCGFDPNNPAG